jgi:hypothetical protein
MFRDGPAVRRAVVIGGPDVWEIVGAIRSMPERGEARVPALAERLGISENKVRVAIRCYGEYPEEPSPGSRTAACSPTSGGREQSPC